jgi:hypothetical protein
MISNFVKYRVVRVENNQVEMQQLSTINKTISVGDIFQKIGTHILYSVNSVDKVPDVNKYSGDLIYTASTNRFMPTREQLITLRTYINF